LSIFYLTWIRVLEGTQHWEGFRANAWGAVNGAASDMGWGGVVVVGEGVKARGVNKESQLFTVYLQVEVERLMRRYRNKISPLLR